MEDKTIKDDFNFASKKPETTPKRNYSHKEVIEKIDAMASVRKTDKQKEEMLRIKDKYVERVTQGGVNRVVRRRNYQMGIAAGIHPRETLERLETLDRIQDQRLRNKTMAKAKDYYHRNYSISKEFRTANPRGRNRDMDMDRG